MHKVLLVVLLLATLIVSCAPGPSPTTAQSIVLTECVLSSPRVETQVEANCGSLRVLENPSDPQSREISLNIAVVPAIKRNPEPDPLFVLAGGPGQAVTEVFPSLYSTFFRIHQQRDIVLVDQRGTGKSNPLRCLDPEDETLEALDEEQVHALLKECPETLEADLRFYTTDIAMRDLDRARAALGYDSINLYGASYGTRAALVYLKLFPAQVRSIVLDAVVDPGFVIYENVAEDGQRALDMFFARCEADEVCHSTFPELRSEFDALLQRVEQTPVDITIAHPVTGRPLELTITQTMLINIIFNTLYVPDLIAMLPLAIHQAYAEDNYAPLITQSYLVNSGIYEGMFYAVACMEDAPLISSETLDQSGEQSLFTENAKTFLDVCSAWPEGNPPEVVHEPVSSDVPVLMLSGEVDPITPPRHAEQLAETLDNDLHLIFESMGHGNSSNQCAAKIIDRFVESASTEGLETECVESVAPPPFFVDFSGPKP
jgi:pimeloyl-ACP methyl ester carboxylesterase